LYSRVSQTYVTTNQWGIELSSNAAREISNGIAWGEGGGLHLFTLKKIKKEEN
jgi:hypothetical protein